MKTYDNLWIQGIIFILLSGFAIAQITKGNSPESNQTNPTNPTPTNPTTLNAPARTFKITLTVRSLKDIKVEEGAIVSQGQVLADRQDERRRLTQEKNSILLNVARVEQTPIPTLKPTPTIVDLPSESFDEEKANIDQAELLFIQAQRNYNAALTNDPFVGASAGVAFQKSSVEAAYRSVELQAKKLQSVTEIKGLPEEVLAHETEKYKTERIKWEQETAMYNLKVAEFKQMQSSRKDLMLSLQNNVENARLSLELKQARLRKAKEERDRKEYQHKIELAKQIEQSNQTELEISQQKLDREFKRSELQEKLREVNEKLGSIPVIVSPYGGKIKKIKTEKQSDNNILITMYLSYN